MAEESMMSTAGSGVEPPPGVAAGSGAQAEMITKKLANYWCIIGSIPLVMFLLVAIPTIFYVKKFSEYVNAEYCDTKSCKELADVILKMGDASDACKSFSAYVCKAKADYAVEALNKMATEAGVLEFKEAKGLGTVELAKAFISGCSNIESPPDEYDSGLPDGMGIPMDINAIRQLPPEKLAGTMATYGIDSIVRAVHVVGNTSGNEEVASMLQLSAPIEDMFVHTMLDMGGVTLKEMALLYQPADEEVSDNLENFITTFHSYAVSMTSKIEHHIGKEMQLFELTNPQFPGGWDWTQFFAPFKSLQLDYVTDNSFIMLAHPPYLLGLDGFFADWKLKDIDYHIFTVCMMQAIARIYNSGLMTLKSIPRPIKTAACVMLAARLFPASLDHLLFYQRNQQFGAANGINAGGTNTSAMTAFLSSQVQGMLDSMTFSYSLSQNATEENRVNFYRRVRSMQVSPGFLNGTDGLRDAELIEMAQAVKRGDDFDVYGAAQQVMQTFRDLYWKEKNTTYLKFRNRYSPLYATYTPTEDHLYVPMGVFTKPIFRNSQKNRIFAATSGFLVMSGVMKALSMSGSMVIHGQLPSENWVGYSWSRTMQKYAACVSSDRKQNGTMTAALDTHILAAMVPAYRYFKRTVFAKAFPRPEFRIDWVSDLSSTQLFFYDWALLHCNTKMGKELIDINAKNSPYFQESFRCEKGSPMYKEVRSMCDLWNTTRRHY